MTKRLNSLIKLSLVTLMIGTVGAGCSKSASFSLLSDTASFTQNSAAVNGKIDILFVIDNSGSMATSQQALATNIQTFFDKFDAKGFDYQIAVTTTDAYRANFGGTGAAALAQYRDGTSATTHTGVFVVKPTTPSRVSVFKTNILQGTSGNGDERAFSSFEAALGSSLNSTYNFPRPEAFFSVIMLSDADDLSATTSASIDTSTLGPYGSPAHMAMYSNPNLFPVQHYIDYLDTKFGVTGSAQSNNRASKYNVNVIGVIDTPTTTAASCEVASEGNKHGDRMKQLANSTGGVAGSLCENFGTTLADISYKIIELRTRFFLDRSIVPDSLRVYVNNVEIPRVTDATPQPWNGFYYHADDNSVSFHGAAVPGPGAAISVTFDPTSIK